MKKPNIKRILFVSVAIFAFAVSLSSCKSSQHCPAYTQIDKVEDVQNS